VKLLNSQVNNQSQKFLSSVTYIKCSFQLSEDYQHVTMALKTKL